jgi:hypothetical protein
MNPYYAAGFLSALVTWVWPAFLYRSLDVHWLAVLAFTALIWLGGGRVATEVHIRFIAPRNPPKGSPLLIAGMCVGILGFAFLTRAVHLAWSAQT